MGSKNKSSHKQNREDKEIVIDTSWMEQESITERKPGAFTAEELSKQTGRKSGAVSREIKRGLETGKIAKAGRIRVSRDGGTAVVMSYIVNDADTVLLGSGV